MNLLTKQNWPEAYLDRLRVKEVLVCGNLLHPPLYSHVVNFPRLELPLLGCYENQIEARGNIVTVRLQQGSALFAAPNCWNLPVWQSGSEVMSLLFGARQIGISIVTAQQRRGPQLAVRKFSVTTPQSGPLSPLLETLTRSQAAGNGPEIFPELARALICCVRHLLRQPALTETMSRPQRLLESICVFLQNHYQYEITRDSVAAHFDITPNHLSRLFKTHGNMTFSNYLTHVRIDRAKHLLNNYNLKLEEVSNLCGYCDAPYFCHVFKRLAKMTPVEYRGRMHKV